MVAELLLVRKHGVGQQGEHYSRLHGDRDGNVVLEKINPTVVTLPVEKIRLRPRLTGDAAATIPQT